MENVLNNIFVREHGVSSDPWYKFLLIYQFCATLVRVIRLENMYKRQLFGMRHHWLFKRRSI